MIGKIKIACNRPSVVIVPKHYSKKFCYSSTLTKFQELECKWTGQMEEYTKKNSLPPPRSFSSSIKSLSVHSDCRIWGLIVQNFQGGAEGMPQNPLAIRIALRSSTGECDFLIKSWAINFLSGLLLFFPWKPSWLLVCKS